MPSCVLAVAMDQLRKGPTLRNSIVHVKEAGARVIRAVALVVHCKSERLPSERSLGPDN